ncbi:glutamate--tRNA ligase [Vallicoccus soli]|uniref:Glutamate--tRNA ligase n=1 Tax=Vallicoccus soli TaxID=2339232 RepID=A0A3A3Z8I7_9ACTN|nr:glutamate--tRNA ligase [Vallicoccus soli]RJK98227.1 glutamate--tRNA ligase [Vallicoccus soli]
MAEGSSVRVRFAPSPSGDLHVGNIRTALYDWAYARHTGGTFVFRIEDTDRSRVTDEYIAAAAETLRWLGLDWDEGPEVGGDRGPYQQSQRMDLYREWAQRFLDEGHAYRCYCSPEELDERREEQKRKGLPPGYDGRCRTLSAEQVAAFEAEGRQPVLRFRMPEGSTTFVDAIRGEVTFDHANVPDFVLVRADGYPLYTLAVAVDDVLMGITHILRGEDLLSSTPRQIAVYRAMGVTEERTPVFGHLPFVMGQDNVKLSKRNGEVSIAWYRREGFLPEALCNYLALLGWSPGEDREDFTLEEMARDFTIERVGKNPARFDMKKLEAINGDKVRALPLEDFVGRILPFLQQAGLVSAEPTAQERALVEGLAPHVQERIARLSEVPGLMAFLLVDDAHFTVDPEAAARLLTPEQRPVLEASVAALEALGEWTHGAIEAALRSALLADGLGLKPKHAFGPVRVAVTGARISPPLFESMELLGRERSLARLRAALEQAA